MDREPAENISGGADGGGQSVSFSSDGAATRAEAVVNRLGTLFWEKQYGGQNAFRCLVRTVLSQNTSDKASQPAFDSLCAAYAGGDLAESLASTEQDVLAETIRHAGLYNQKAAVLIELARHVCAEYSGEGGFDAFVKTEEASVVRSTLLELTGVGPKTADCVLLFAGGRHGVFPVDTHVHRIYRRLGIAPPDADHETVRAVLERDVPPEKCGFGHTASIQFGREYCTARVPVCVEAEGTCPLLDVCDQVGVDTDTGSVADPGAAIE